MFGQSIVPARTVPGSLNDRALTYSFPSTPVCIWM